MLSRIERSCAALRAPGGGYSFDHSTIPAVVNDAACAAIVQRTAAALLGPENVGEGRTTGADDMAAFLEAAPGAYFMLGGGNAARGITWPHHHPKFDFDEDCLPLGIELGMRIIEEASDSKLALHRGPANPSSSPTTIRRGRRASWQSDS
jgi:amidohydrolase